MIVVLATWPNGSKTLAWGENKMAVWTMLEEWENPAEAEIVRLKNHGGLDINPSSLAADPTLELEDCCTVQLDELNGIDVYCGDAKKYDPGDYFKEVCFQ